MLLKKSTTKRNEKKNTNTNKICYLLKNNTNEN